MIVFLGTSGLQGIWQLIFGVQLPEGLSPELQALLARTPLDMLLELFFSVLSLAMAWKLYKLQRSVIKLAWLSMIAWVVSYIMQVAFTDRARVLYAEVGIWIVVSFGFYALLV